MVDSKLNKPRSASISQMRVEELFGYFSYVIPSPEDDYAGYERLMILYGDNGSGKTTILTLLFSLLSPVTGRGEKTYVAKMPFRRFEISFDDGLKIAAIKKKGLLGSYTVLIEQPSKRSMAFEIEADDSGSVGHIKDQTDDLLAYLKTLGISLYFLPDHRNVRTTIGSETDPEDDDDEFTILSSSGRSLLTRPSQRRREPHHLELASVLLQVSSWFRSHAFLGSSAGEENATNIYLSVVENLAQWPPIRLERIRAYW
jgi:energy-coupling factor transporter ATP-binding protein EcfA2